MNAARPRPRRRAFQPQEGHQHQGESTTCDPSTASFSSESYDLPQTMQKTRRRKTSSRKRHWLSEKQYRWWRRNRELVLLGCATCVVLLILIQLLGLVFMLQYNLGGDGGFLEDLGDSWFSWILGAGGDSAFEDFFDEADRLPILVIGGTDGSGTRAFVDTLKTLGVPILADDPKTFDIHANCMFRKKGWPALVNTVLKETHSADYDWESLSADTQIIVEREVRRLMRNLSFKYGESIRRRKNLLGTRLFGGQTPPWQTSDKVALSSQVAFAIKAPVAMLVLPVLSRFFGPIKFLHVLRDGRDIALSNNQSPVLKFYNNTYKNYENRSKTFRGDLYPVRGMQLWADWNLQVHTYAKRTASNLDSTGSLEYLATRSEDLLSPKTKLECLQRLATYVGSTFENDRTQLCCLSQAATQDFGASSIHSETTNNFASHPELWEQMGSHHGRIRRHKIPHLLDDDLPMGQPRKHHRRAPPPDGGKFRNSEDEEESAIGEQDQLLEWKEGLEQKELELHKLEVSLSKKQMELEQREAALNHSAAIEGRRRLETDDQPQAPPKEVPIQMVRIFTQWKEHVMTGVDSFQLETLLKMVDFGEDLKQQWEKNKEVLEGVLEVKDIDDTIQYIKDRMEKRGDGKPLDQIRAERNAKKLASAVSVHERYGKWKAQLESKPDLSRWLHAEGREALEVFGYEPTEVWSYRDIEEEAFRCDESIQCRPHGTTTRRKEQPKGGHTTIRKAEP